MNYFERQQQDHNRTEALFFLFALAVLAAAGAMDLLLYPFAKLFLSLRHLPVTWLKPILWTNAVVVVTAILCGSLYRIYRLSDGGKAVALAAGGTLIERTEAEVGDARQTQVLDLVEELAIASATAVPDVYRLAERNVINGFAAGYGSRDAVIVLTDGAIENLPPEELAGLLAHEFSHLAHQDTQLNLRLQGMLHGLVILGAVGTALLRRAAASRKASEDGEGFALLAFLGGIVLCTVGGIPLGFGRLVKCAIGREREFIADGDALRAVQDPAAFVSLLKRLWLTPEITYLRQLRAEEVSHAFFCEGFPSFLSEWLSVQPSLQTRVHRLDPSIKLDHRERLPLALDLQGPTQMLRPANASTASAITQKTGALVPPSQRAMQSIASFSMEHRRFARKLLAQLPLKLREAARQTESAESLLYASFLHRDREVRERQKAFCRKAPLPRR